MGTTARLAAKRAGHASRNQAELNVSGARHDQVQAHAAEAATPHWSYAGETGPEQWGSEDPSFAICGTGKRQSPIKIEKTAVKALP